MARIGINGVLVACLVVGAGCGASKATGDDGGGGDAPSGVAGGGGEAGASGGAGVGGHVGGAGAGGQAGGGGKGGTGGVGTTLPACPGVDPTPASQACRTAADCAQPFSTCGATYHAAGCGACIPPLDTCSADGGCPGDEVCVPAANPCGCTFAGRPATMCTARCTATSCAAFEACDTSSGLCKPRACGPAYTCPAGRVCAPARAGADVNGCAIASCSSDGYACPAGTTCAPGAGADANGCAPVSCVGGAYACPPNTDCKASSTSPHHCERRACTSDRTCDCGACVEGACADRVFVCSPPPAA